MIRLAVAGDADAVRACAQSAYGRYVALIGREPAPMQADFPAQIAAGRVHVAVEDDVLLGYVVFYPRGDHMHLESVAVMPDAAGRGTGRALIAACEAAARAMGLEAVQLYTNAAMIENLSIYPRLGYVETGRAIENGFARVYFEKRLNAGGSLPA